MKCPFEAHALLARNLKRVLSLAVGKVLVSVLTNGMQALQTSSPALGLTSFILLHTVLEKAICTWKWTLPHLVPGTVFTLLSFKVSLLAHVFLQNICPLTVAISDVDIPFERCKNIIRLGLRNVMAS